MLMREAVAAFGFVPLPFAKGIRVRGA